MRQLFSTLSLLWTLPVLAAVNVPLIVQEAVYPGSVAGVSRTNDPVSVGVPLPDDPTTGVSDVNQLTLTGASVGQFRVLGRWPSGRIKWVLVDTQANLAAGQTNTSIAITSGGTGNFGGANLATDNGATITVSTGAGTFTIRKANFNVVDGAVVGGKTVVSSGASQGLVIIGPPPGQATCSPCSTVYSSANDASSTAVIEENGPAKTVIKASGRHVDASGNAYLNFTVRMHFYKGKAAVKVTSILRNADYGASNTFASAYKGMQAYELRVLPQTTGALNYSIAGDPTACTSGVCSGTNTATDDVFIYQGQSNLMKNGELPVPYTTDAGYKIVKNGVAVASGDATKYAGGWASISDSSGVGVDIGVYQMAAYWPKSLQFTKSEARVGIWPAQNSQPYYQAWPDWSIHDIYLNFRASAAASPATGFLQFQHPLVARADRTHYNNSSVFFYPLLDPAEEDQYMIGMGAKATPALDKSFVCCIQDKGLSNPVYYPLFAYRQYYWPLGGGGNQMEFRWSDLQIFLRRGHTGRYLDASHFYRMVAERSFPHSDGFNWRDKAPAEFDAWSFPTAVSANASLSYRNWIDQEHAHWYGMTDYYFMSGDETIKDAILDGPKDRFLNTQAVLNNGYLWNSRSIGNQLMATARMYQFLQAIGDPEANVALTQGIKTYELQIKPEMCTSGYPVGCSVGDILSPQPGTTGVSRTRGAPYGWKGAVLSTCSSETPVRAAAAFQLSILLQGMWELREAAGKGWADYDSSLDLAYGISNFALTEMYADNGTASWVDNGFRYYISLDSTNTCDPYFPARANQTVWFPFLIQHAYDGGIAWTRKFETALLRMAGANAKDELGHFSIGAVIDRLKRPGNTSLVNVPVTVANKGGGSYTLSWTVPANARSYRIKTGPKQIVEWIGFDPGTNKFTGDPASTMAWFAAASVANPPAPAVAGSTQTFVVTGQPASGQQFAIKAVIDGPAAPMPDAPLVSMTSPASGATVSGNVALSATATSQAGIASVQFQVDGVNLGSALPPSGSSYTQTWNSTQVANGSRTVSVTARDTAGKTATSSVVVSVNNVVAAPVISNVTAGAITATTAVVTWNTDKPSSSQVAYGTTASYGATTSGSSTLETAHTVALSGLLASTTYSYQVVSTDAAGKTSSSGNLTFTTAASSSAGDSAWKEQSGTKLINVCPPDNFGGWGYNFAFHCPGVISAWSGGVADTKRNRLIIWGGGHNDYYGNELYSLNLNSSSATLTRLNDPSPINKDPMSTADLSDGQANSRHTYNNLVYMPHVDRMFVFYGATAGPTVAPTKDTWTLDMETLEWKRMDPANGPIVPSSGYGVHYAIAGYDPNTKTVLMNWSGTFWRYTYETNSYELLNNNTPVPYAGSGVIDPQRKLFIYMGHQYESTAPTVMVTDITPGGKYETKDWSALVSGCDALASASYPGLAYDSTRGRIIGWPNSGSVVYEFNPDTKSCSPISVPNGPPDTVPSITGTFGRFQYFAALDAFAVVFSAKSNAFLLDLKSGGATDDKVAPTVPSNLTATPSSLGVALSWTASTDNKAVAGYNIYRNAVKIGASTSASYSDTGLAAGVTYSYTVASYDASGNVSAQSAAASVTTSGNACDLNADQIVNATDVSLAIDQVLGKTICTSTVLKSLGQCNVVGVQRVISASLGGACISGQ